MRRRLQDPVARSLWKQRARIIEPRFGQIKQHDGFRRWTVWGWEGVKTQWTMLCTTLNLRILYRHWQAGRWPEKRKYVSSPEPENGGSRVKTVWPNPKSTRAVVAEAIGLGSRA